MGLELFYWSNSFNLRTLVSHRPGMLTIMGQMGTFNNLEQYFDSLKRNIPDRGYYPIPLKALWLCIRTISKRGNYLASVMGLRCERVCIILTVISGMMNPKAIGSKSGWRNGILTFMFSEKRRRNILRRVTRRRHVRSNRSGSFWYRCSRGWKMFCRKSFCLIFYLENRKLSLKS